MIPQNLRQIDGTQKILLAESQTEDYIPLAALVIPDDPRRRHITEWAFTDEERAIIAAGGVLRMSVYTFGHHFQPTALEVIPEADRLPLETVS